MQREVMVTSTLRSSCVPIRRLFAVRMRMLNKWLTLLALIEHRRCIWEAPIPRRLPAQG
jgi:hypothetical protein